MSYSDDTAEFMFSGRPTMEELEPRLMCESCHQRPRASQVTYGDGTQFMLCVECRPFDPKEVHVVNLKPDPDQPTGPSY